MNLVLNKQLAEAIEQSETEELFSRLSAIQEISRNPMGVEMQKMGNATAFTVKNIPGPSFNTVKGLRDEDAKLIPQIVEFYDSKEIPVKFELAPTHCSPKLLQQLAEAGFYQNDFHTALYTSLPSSLNWSNSPISVRRLEKHEMDIFAEIYITGFGMPEFLKSGIAQNNEVLFESGNWYFYLACLGDVPAGIGVMFIKDGIGTLAAATTIPSFRNRGIQSALIIERLKTARALECKIVTGQSEFGSPSQNNMEKAGLSIAYTKAIWLKRQSRNISR